MDLILAEGARAKRANARRPWYTNHGGRQILHRIAAPRRRPATWNCPRLEFSHRRLWPDDSFSPCWLPLHRSTAWPAQGADETLFRQSVAPLFEQRCIRCHGAGDPKGGLNLTTAKSALAGGDSGAAIVPGKPGESPLLAAISGDKPEMPKEGPALSAGEVAAIGRWIAEGAAWPDDLVLSDNRAASADWWSLKPLSRVPLPVTASPWVRTPVDAFILAKLDEQQLTPSDEADRRTLIRRLTYDLHGLPPTPDEIDAFVADTRGDAYEKLVDRLLASPRYGERWGRFWLDVVHYGESHGYDKDKPRPNAWPYRDYVIASFNDDKPYDRFVAEQIAGDVLYPDDPQAVVATGFIAAGPWDFVGHVELREGTVDKDIARSNDRDDMVASTMSTFTSLTVHCARCHNHKFDPIRQADYYSLQAVFAGVERADRPYDARSTDGSTTIGAGRRANTLECRLWRRLPSKRAKVTSPQIVGARCEFGGTGRRTDGPAARDKPSQTLRLSQPDHAHGRCDQVGASRSRSTDGHRRNRACAGARRVRRAPGPRLRFSAAIQSRSRRYGRLQSSHACWPTITTADFAHPGDNSVPIAADGSARPAMFA